MENQISQLVTSRIEQLLANARAAAAVSHGGTVGAVREQHLRDFLSALLPPPLAITSGFISDPLGKLTPQLDMIVYDPTRIPPIALPGDVAVVPSDSALAMGEIKSTLSSDALDQLLRQLSAITEMAHSGEGGGEESSVIIPQIVVAFESNVSIQTLNSWFDECPNLVLISVLSQATFAKVGNNQRNVTIGSPANRHMHIRAFVAHFFKMLHQVAALRREVTPRFAAYLMPEWLG